MVTNQSEPTPPPPMKETTVPDNANMAELQALIAKNNAIYNENMVELQTFPAPDDDSDIVIQKICFDKSKTPFVLMSKDRPDAGCLGPCLINVMGQTFYINNTYNEVRKILFG